MRSVRLVDLRAGVKPLGSPAGKRALSVVVAVERLNVGTLPASGGNQTCPYQQRGQGAPTVAATVAAAARGEDG